MLGVVAHDLRNPLHLVMATTDLLSEPTLPEERRRELLAVMTRAVTHMRRLAHGGSIAVDSTVGKGSTFCIKFPIGTRAEAQGKESSRQKATV